MIRTPLFLLEAHLAGMRRHTVEHWADGAPSARCATMQIAVK